MCYTVGGMVQYRHMYIHSSAIRTYTVVNAYASAQRSVLEISAAKMESMNPTPPSLVHDRALSSRSASGSGGTELAQFREMLVQAMRYPRVRSAVLPGPMPHCGKLPVPQLFFPFTCQQLYVTLYEKTKHIALEANLRYRPK